MNEIHWVKINEEDIALKKDRLGWRVVEPFIRPDGTRNWFGSKRGFFTILGMLGLFLLALGLFQSQLHSMKSYCSVAMQNPIEFCANVAKNLLNVSLRP